MTTFQIVFGTRLFFNWCIISKTNDPSTDVNTMARRDTNILGRLGLPNGKSRARTATWQLNPERATKSTPEDILRWIASMTPDTALAHLVSSSDGISEAEATARRRIQGQNVVSSRKPQSWFMLLLSVIPNPFNILLMFLAILNVAMPDPSWEGFAVLMVMIVISVAVRFWQEFQSGVAIFRLQSAIIPKIRTDLVPGDIVILVPGAIVPADCLILESSYLRISQSAWTGESEPVGKEARPHDAKEAFSIFDFSNVALMGTNIVSGHGVGLVVRTGDDAMIATMVKEVEKKRQPNAFQKGILNVTWMLIGFMIVMVPIVLCISGKVTGDWKNAALFSISVAVGLVPEMLPAIVNANLARAAHQLSKKQAIVKRLDSVQNLGAMTVLCSDKTGTLTKDELSVHKFSDAEGEDILNIMELAKVDSQIQGNSGNNMDRAILNYHLPNGDEIGVAHHEQVRVIPFDFERRRSGCIVRGITGQYLLIVKGAFDEVLTRCSSMRSAGKSEYLSTEMQARWRQLAMQKNMEGYRVLLVASRILGKSYVNELDMLETNMTLEGMISFSDPPKDDAKDAIASLTELGVQVKVLTGDSLPVALNICRSLELLQHSEAMDDDAEAISGPELALLEDSDEFDLAVERCSVFAKVTPKQKSLIVLALQKAGNCVGMLDDGINDCGALRDADVGISVDSGAGVAKDCADLILTEKGLSIIMVASSNFGNVFSILAASAWLPFTPMTSIQLLAQNLLYDISQIAIPWDRVDEEYLTQPRRWNAKDILKFIVVLGPTSSVIDMCTFSLNWFFYGIRTTSDNVKLAQTHWFLQGLLTQTLIVHLLRTAPILVFSTASIMAIGFVLPWIPAFRPAFSFAQPAPTFVGFLAAELLLYAVEVQVVKMIYMKIFGTWL
ncbi:hypothetical protein H9Q69_005057 [Fusarium xylarioides]|nr:hypothetical protein H9Q69_005057 [Fusarium xylarioides]